MYEDEWLSFIGRFFAPTEDYGQDGPSGSGAPGYRETLSGSAEAVWVHDEWRCERFWRGWLAGVTDLYAGAQSHLPSVVDKLPPLPPDPSRIDPDEIPF
jgi:hypothetical protein